MSKQPYRKSGFYRALYAAERGELNPEVEETMGAWVQRVTDDLGGPDNLSEQQRTVLGLAAQTRYLLSVVDAWLVEKGELAILHKRDRRLHTIVHDRQRLSNDLLRYLQALGLEGRSPPVEDLTTYLEQKAGKRTVNG